MALPDWERLEDPPSGRVELVDGRVRVNPAPRFIHQHAVRLLTNALAAASGPDYLAIIDGEWRIPDLDSTSLRHVRRPDVLFAAAFQVRGQAALTGAAEAPLVVAEILSPGNRKPDISRKRAMYFEHGARHYVEVTITRDEQEATITWYRRGPKDWVEAASARGDAILTIGEPFELAMRPNGLLF